MPSPERNQPTSNRHDHERAIGCEACQAAVDGDQHQAISFLLLDTLTIPLLSCDDHLEQFSSICGVTTDDTVDLLKHRPAGGITCPGCRLSPYNAGHPMVPVQDGAIGLLACPEHQAEIIQRFHTGLETRQQLTASLGPTTDTPR